MSGPMAGESAMSAQDRWTAVDVPDQDGRVAVVTGANTGIGFETAEVLAARGATVVLACRDPGRTAGAVARIGAAVPGAALDTVQVDLASLASVRAAAGQLRSRYPRLDLLINNAGLMMPPYGRTTDGFELQFGTNHLGHFALTGLLLDRLLAVPGSRIVTVSSKAHGRGRINLADLQFEHGGYRRMAAYGQSKLANLMFTYELQRRLAAAGAPTIAVAAHPGGSRTELMRNSPFVIRVGVRNWSRPFTSRLLQDPPMGALPVLRAATDPAVRGGEYYGPGGWGELTGHPVRVSSTGRSHDVETQHRLWTESERLTGVSYPLAELHGAGRA
jgi:NAD(P)-dependent dehydrogenase (short-subunit alcohol dehydrogenase family)